MHDVKDKSILNTIFFGRIFLKTVWKVMMMGNTDTTNVAISKSNQVGFFEDVW
jgi:hypothetical protein